MADVPQAALGGARDLSRRLALFGGIAIVVGIGACGLGLLNLTLPLLGRMLPSAPPTDWRAAVAGASTWLMIGAVIIWAGFGSMRYRRWTRPIMLTLSWTWLLSGAMALALGWLMLDDLLAQSAAQSGQALPPELIVVVKTLLLGAIGAGGIVLPAIFVWAYNDRDVLATCIARHPEPDWTEACPVPVLGISLGLGACGVLGLPLALNAVVPFFGIVVTGLPGVVLVLAGAAACLWLARADYRLEARGWWGTAAFLVAVGATVVITFLRVPVEDYFVAYGLPPEQALGMKSFGPFLVWGCVVVTIASVAYLIAVKKHFRG